MALEVVATIIVVVIVVLIRILAGRILGRLPWASIEERRGWIVLVRNLVLVVGLFAVALIWADELRVIGLSLVAVAVAVAIVLQDVVKSMVAALVRAASGAYSVGDRVQIGEHRGQVIDHSLLSTTLIEVSEGHTRTGRTIIVPNSLLLTHAVRNETAGHHYILHSFRVPAPLDRWRDAHDVLLEAARKASAPYVAPARRQMELRAERHAISPPNVEPFVTPRPTSPDEVDLIVRLPVAAAEIGRVEDQIIRSWLDSIDTPPPAE